MKRRFLSLMTTAMIAATSWAQVPQADLLDVVFKTDGTAEDVSAMKNEVQAVGWPKVKQSLKYGMNTACLDGNVWGFLPQSYYRVNYEENQAFRDALKDGLHGRFSFAPSVMSLTSAPIKQQSSRPMKAVVARFLLVTAVRTTRFLLKPTWVERPRL